MKSSVETSAVEARRAEEQAAIKRRLEAVNKLMAILEPLDGSDRSLVMKTVAIFYGYNPDNY